MSWSADTQSKRSPRADSGKILGHALESGVCECKQLDSVQLCFVIPRFLITAKTEMYVLGKPLFVWPDCMESTSRCSLPSRPWTYSGYENLTLNAGVFDYLLKVETRHHFDLLILRCRAIENSKATNGLAIAFHTY